MAGSRVQLSSVQRALVCAVLTALIALVAVAVGPVGVAMAEPPPVTIVSPVDGGSILDQTPWFSGTTNGTTNSVTLHISGTSATGTPVPEEITTLSPAAGEWSFTPTPLLGEGTYTVVATQPYELEEISTSALVTFTVDAAPSITSNPVDQTVLAGQPATFTASASGFPTPGVQWQVSTDGGSTWMPDTTDAGSATGTLTVANTTTAEGGQEYQAVFTNSIDTATSTPATLTVNAAPVVITNPTSKGVKVGEPATFTATASGAPTPKVQWEESTDFGSTWTDDKSDSGNATGTLTVTGTTVAESGHEFRAVFTNGVGSPATSTAATLTVAEKATAPVITGDPVDQTVLAGEGAVFVAVASGIPTPKVQWQVSANGGLTWANDTSDSGHTTETLTVLGATPVESGREFRAVFTNTMGTETTTAAKLTVTTPTVLIPPVTPTSPTIPTPPATPTPTPPAAAFTWLPARPTTGQNVVLVSSSTDAESPITGYAWDAIGSGTFTAGGPAITMSFATPGNHTVRLRVTDGNGLTSVATETIPVSAAPLVLMQPFPVVRIAGSESSSGVKLSLLTVQAPVGTRVSLTCGGSHCPRRSESRVVVASRKNSRAGSVLLTFSKFERSLQAGVMLEIRVSKPGEIGKYTSFRIRPNKAPARVDACVGPSTPKPIPCPSS